LKIKYEIPNTFQAKTKLNADSNCSQVEIEKIITAKNKLPKYFLTAVLVIYTVILE
jgi:hypothetical protein